MGKRSCIDEYFQVVGCEQPEQPQLKRTKRGRTSDHEDGVDEAPSCVVEASECDMVDLLLAKPTTPIATDDGKEKKAKKSKLPGFSRKGLSRKWCNKPTYDLVCGYLLKHGMELDQGESQKYAEWKRTTKVSIWCRKCKTTSDSTCLSNLQQGQGIACFCSGSMPLSSRQYYDTVMNNAELCKELGCYTAFHREVAPVEKPSFEVWEPVAAQGKDATLKLTCSRCKTTSDSTSLNNLQKGHGIACGCVNKTEGLVWFPELRKQATDDGHELLCDTAGQYKPDHLCAQTGKGDLSRRKFDGGLRILPIGRSTSGELDGRHHFEDVRRWTNSAVENQRIDGAKVRSGLAAGEWNVRYHQEGVWTDAYQWRTFMRKAHAHIAAAGCDAAPKVILPEHYRPEYTRWLVGAGIEQDRVAWM